mmetsp:Transcript_19874/g.48200  ORF Transcript_19874/g.48200 Transcript_19874/m.48200 type:complete len:232 (-) Transcript_19874:193-888(-)
MTSGSRRPRGSTRLANLTNKGLVDPCRVVPCRPAMALSASRLRLNLTNPHRWLPARPSLSASTLVWMMVPWGEKTAMRSSSLQLFGSPRTYRFAFLIASLQFLFSISWPFNASIAFDKPESFAKVDHLARLYRADLREESSQLVLAKGTREIVDDDIRGSHPAVVLPLLVHRDRPPWHPASPPPSPAVHLLCPDAIAGLCVRRAGKKRKLEESLPARGRQEDLIPVRWTMR